MATARELIESILTPGGAEQAATSGLDIGGLLTGALTPDQRRQQMMETERALLSSPQVLRQPGGATAAFMPRRNEQLRQSIGSLFGLDTRLPRQRAAEEISNLDLSSPEGVQQAIGILREVDPARAVQLSQAFQQRQAQQQQQTISRTAMLQGITESNLPMNQKRMLAQAVRGGFFDDDPRDLLDRLGMDMETLAASSGSGAGGGVAFPGTENLDPDAYTQESFQDYLESVQAGQPDLTLLEERQRPPEGYEFVRNEDETVRGVRPVRGTEEYRELRATVQAEQNAASDATEQAQNVIDITERAIRDIEDGEAATGFSGFTLSRVPGTDTFALSEDLDTIKANLGFDKLQAMRDASPTGGALGQVSERELAQLERAMRSLTIGQPRDRLLTNLREVQRRYRNILEKINTNVTMDSILGFEDTQQNRVGEFVVEEVE